eukprot:6258054-Ditylum_brightwellii.AAC.1
MTIVSLTTSNDEGAGFRIMDPNCTATEAPDMALSSSLTMPADWKFDKDTVAIITSKRKEDESIVAAKNDGSNVEYLEFMVEKHR